MEVSIAMPCLNEAENMNKKIAILRGINVGGRRKILMADLKLLFEDFGFNNISTYIQSGNVIFDDTTEISDLEIANTIEAAILNKYKFTVPVIVVSSKDLVKAVKSNPYYQGESVDISKLHLTFLKEKPTKESLQKIATYNYEPDKFVIKGQNVFIFCEGKYHQSKLTNNFFERKLAVSATTRNWKTVLKLVELSK